MHNHLASLDLNERVLDRARTNFVRIRADQTVGAAPAHVPQDRNQPIGRIVCFYALDDDGRLKGVVLTRRLLLNKPETPVTDLLASITAPLLRAFLGSPRKTLEKRVLASGNSRLLGRVIPWSFQEGAL